MSSLVKINLWNNKCSNSVTNCSKPKNVC